MRRTWSSFLPVLASTLAACQVGEVIGDRVKAGAANATNATTTADERHATSSGASPDADTSTSGTSMASEVTASTSGPDSAAGWPDTGSSGTATEGAATQAEGTGSTSSGLDESSGSPGGTSGTSGGGCQVVNYDAIADAFVNESLADPCVTWNGNDPPSGSCQSYSFGRYGWGPVWTNTFDEDVYVLARFDLGPDRGSGRQVAEAQFEINAQFHDVPLRLDLYQMNVAWAEGEGVVDEPSPSGARWDCADDSGTSCDVPWPDGTPNASARTFIAGASLSQRAPLNAITVPAQASVVQRWVDGLDPMSVLVTAANTDTPHLWMYGREGGPPLRLVITYCDT